MGSPRQRVVVVTGGSAGVGRAAAVAFARAGAAVGVLARGRERLDAAAAEVEASGGRALAVPVDVADPAAVDDAAGQIEDALGPIDVWVNAAMTSVLAPVTNLSADEIRRVTDVTYLGSVHGILAALERMRARNAGTIVQVGSALAYRAIPLQASYCGSKFAIRGFVDAVRCELRHDGSAVRVVSVHLPAVNTPQFEWVRSRMPRHPRPVAPVYQPEVAARAIVWAADHERREVWVGASAVGTILGAMVGPGLLDRYLARTAYDAQQTDEHIRPDRPDNLCGPVPGVHGAGGRFGSEAKDRSLQLELSLRRRPVAGLVSAIGAAGLTTWRRHRAGP